MQYTTYIRKENEEAFKAVEKKSELINKLLQVYFQKHGKGGPTLPQEPTYTPLEDVA